MDSPFNLDLSNLGIIVVAYHFVGLGPLQTLRVKIA